LALNDEPFSRFVITCIFALSSANGSRMELSCQAPPAPPGVHTSAAPLGRKMGKNRCGAVAA
jgi:hypothetical protein